MHDHLRVPEYAKPPARVSARGMLPAAHGEQGWLAERYLLAERLGFGAFGTVYAADDRLRGERVAVKLLTADDAAAIRCFQTEFRAVVHLDHPNVVRVHALHHDRGRWLYSMELVPGRSFVDDLARCDLPVASRLQRVTTRLGQLAAGLTGLHRHGHVHGDLKPANTLVTPAGRVVLIDFGLASPTPPSDPAGDPAGAARSGATGTPRLGTLAYMAPERLTGAAPSAASDWFGVGVMLFEALTGHLPWPGGLRVGRRTDGPPSARAAVPQVPAALDHLCRRLLAANPGERAGAAAVDATLAAILAAGAGTGRQGQPVGDASTGAQRSSLAALPTADATAASN